MSKIIDKILLILAVIALIASFIGAVYVTADVTGTADERETITETVTWTVGTAVINRRFTRPDNYELLYRTTYENGLSIDRWVAVTREEYFNVGRDSLE